MNADPRGWSLRAPPANLRAEQALLGALLANNKAFDRVGDFLRGTHFADPVNARIFDAIARRVNAGQLADAVTLKAEFEHDGVLAEVGGTAYLAELLTAMVGIINAGEYGRAIHDAWVRRQVIEAAGTALEAAFTPPAAGAPAVIEQLETALLHIAEGAGDVSPVVPAGEAVTSAVRAARLSAARGGGLAGFTTGIAALDRMTKGLVTGQYYVIGARPSMGKTALGLTIAARAAAAGVETLFWSGEMAAAQLGVRLAAAQAHLPTTAVLTGLGIETDPDGQEIDTRALTDAEWHALDDAAAAAARLPLVFDDRAGLTVAALRNRCRRLRRTKHLRLVVVDYIGLMRGSEVARRAGRYAEVSEISADLLAMARELNVTVLALAQLSRANESREDKRPTLADLRDSGAIEQDANVVMFVHRPHYYLTRMGAPERRAKEDDEAYHNRLSEQESRKRASVGVAEIAVAKNRQGPDGLTRLRYIARETWFRDETEFDHAPAW